MAAPKQRQTSAESEPVAPQTAPPISPYGPGGSEMSGFIWQQLSEIQNRLGSIQEAQRSLAVALEKQDTKVSTKLSAIDADLAEIKQIKHTAKWLLIVGAAVGSVVVAIVGFIAKEVWDISKPLVLEKMTQTNHAVPSSVAPQPPQTNAQKK